MSEGRIDDLGVGWVVVRPIRNDVVRPLEEPFAFVSQPERRSLCRAHYTIPMAAEILECSPWVHDGIGRGSRGHPFADTETCPLPGFSTEGSPEADQFPRPTLSNDMVRMALWRRGILFRPGRGIPGGPANCLGSFTRRNVFHRFSLYTDVCSYPQTRSP